MALRASAAYTGPVKKRSRLVVVSDVDGCLRDSATGSCGNAREAVDRLERAGVPLVLCSSKTRAELERLRGDLGVDAPFVVENGGAVFVPAGTFPFAPQGSVRRGQYDVVEIGRPHVQVLGRLLATAAKVGVDITTFSDMSVQRVSAECGLSLADARLAKLREYDEPFRLVDPDPEARAKLCRALRSAGLRCASGGQYDHVTLATDKGVATALLPRFYKRAWGEVTFAGLGDNENDVELLAAVDLPVVVRSTDPGPAAFLLARIRKARVTAASGPAGWSEGIRALLDGLTGRPAAADAPVLTSSGSGPDDTGTPG